MAKTNYDKHLFKELRNPEAVASYLSAAAQEGSLREFLIALRNVADAYGGIGELSNMTELNRQTLYRTLSEDGNPTLASLMTILDAIGVSLAFTVQDEEAA